MKKDVLDAKTAVVDERLNYLEQFRRHDDFTTTESLAIKHALQEIIEACLDVASHIISSRSYREPRTNADSFRILEEHDVIDDALSGRLVAMAKMRNVIVHHYDDVDMERVKHVLRDDLGDVRAFLDAAYESEGW